MATVATMPLAAPVRAHAASYPNFDWLRFVLAALVVASHAHLGERLGTLAVDVLFALSGWLIGGILLRSARAELPRFFFNRATRIWIPYAFAVLLLYAVAALRDGDFAPQFPAALMHKDMGLLLAELNATCQGAPTLAAAAQQLALGAELHPDAD